MIGDNVFFLYENEIVKHRKLYITKLNVTWLKFFFGLDDSFFLVNISTYRTSFSEGNEPGWPVYLTRVC